MWGKRAMKGLGVLFSGLLAVVGWSAALAGPPAPWNSYVAPRLVSCPAGDSAFVVIVRDVAGNPYVDAGACVDIDLCSCPGYHLSRAGSHPYSVDSTGCVVANCTVDSHGEALFPLAGGGLCPGESLLVEVGGLYFWPRPKVVSLDQNGDLKVDESDIAIVQSKVGTADLSGDFDGDGQVTVADVAIVRAHVGHHAPEATAVPPSGLGGVAMSSPWPNPFSREANFTLTPERSAQVVVSVHDVAGRQVAVLFDGPANAGERSFAWQGRREDGSPARAGIYFLQAQLNGARLVRRAILIEGR